MSPEQIGWLCFGFVSAQVLTFFFAHALGKLSEREARIRAERNAAIDKSLREQSSRIEASKIASLNMIGTYLTLVDRVSNRVAKLENDTAISKKDKP